MHENIASEGGNNSVLLRIMFDAEEGIRNDTFPSANVIVKDILDNKSVSEITSKISEKRAIVSTESNTNDLAKKIRYSR